MGSGLAEGVTFANAPPPTLMPLYERDKAASFVPPGLKAEMYPEANKVIRHAAITIIAAATTSLTTSLTTVIPYGYFIEAGK